MKISQMQMNIVENTVDKVFPDWEKRIGRPRAISKRRLIQVFWWKNFTGSSWETLSHMLELDCNHRTLNRNYLIWVRSGVFERVYKKPL